MPHAHVALRARSLSDWPKPASLLPPLTASPGAVEFGEAYLSWSGRGLQLATIGQDYFDIDLLAYDGPFPLGEAYRVELGVDLGAGPRRFTLFFIPPRTKIHDYPEMAAELCAGAAPRAIARGCTPVAGGNAVYFGADQPRITAEVRIPWAALGIGAAGRGKRAARRNRGHLLGPRPLDVVVRPSSGRGDARSRLDGARCASATARRRSNSGRSWPGRPADGARLMAAIRPGGSLLTR